MSDIPVWTPEIPESGLPYKCPICGSVGTARGMLDHIMITHPVDIFLSERVDTRMLREMAGDALRALDMPLAAERVDDAATEIDRLRKGSSLDRLAKLAEERVGCSILFGAPVVGSSDWMASAEGHTVYGSTIPAAAEALAAALAAGGGL